MLRAALALALVSLALPAAAATYYVDGSRGRDGNSGLSVSQSWQTLDKANAELKPGDTCFVRGGVYAASQIAPSRSGTARAPIVYAAHGNERPELTGGKFGAIVTLADRSYVVVRGFRIHSPTEHDWVVTMSGAKSHHNRIENCDISDPQGYAPVVIALGASHNTVTGCSVHDTGHREEGSGDCIVINGGHHNTISHNRLYNGCHSQALLLNGSQHNTIADNDLFATDQAWAGAGVNLVLGSDHNAITGNRIHDLGYITDQKCAIQIDTTGNTIRNNTIYNVGAFGISPQSYAYGGKRQEAINNLIANNTIYNTGRQGLMFVSKGDCVSANNRIVKNIVVGSPQGFYNSNAWALIFDTYHLSNPALPGEWFGNVFADNVFFHHRPGESDMVLYVHRGPAVAWSIPQLQAKYPKTFMRNKEVAPQFVKPAKANFQQKPGSPARGAGAR